MGGERWGRREKTGRGWFDWKFEGVEFGRVRVLRGREERGSRRRRVRSRGRREELHSLARSLATVTDKTVRCWAGFGDEEGVLQLLKYPYPLIKKNLLTRTKKKYN